MSSRDLPFFKASGNIPDENEFEMILHREFIIKSADNLSRYIGMLWGPGLLFSRLFIISKTSSLEILANVKFNRFLFFK